MSKSEDQQVPSTPWASERTIQDLEKAVSSEDNPKSTGNPGGPGVFPEKSDIPATAPPSAGPPPDGGLNAWLAVLGGFCGLFVSFGWINCRLMLLQGTATVWIKTVLIPMDRYRCFSNIL